MKIGLVLSGGMAKGAYQIGALKAINNFIPTKDIQYISCSSVGVLNGYAYATDNLKHAENLWRKVCNADTRFFVNQLLKSSLLQQCIESLFDEDKPLNSDFFCSLLDLNAKKLVYKNLYNVSSEKIPIYLKASVAMPLYNKAVSIDGTTYFDGAMIDNIPIFPLLKYELDYILCVYFDDISYEFESPAVNNKVIRITFPSGSRLRQSVLFESNEIQEMIKNGYDATMHILKSVFYKGYDSIDYIYDSIGYINRSSANTKSRITGDILVANLNKVMQKLTKREVL
ncbi:MAG: patatin-like phospholipase family protein [Clostridia bacterium]|nr:patatin-like phospholipase family protein [Clostridia bacterium]